MFPKDAVTFTQELVDIDNVIVLVATPSNPVTVLGVRMQQSGVQSETILECDNVMLAHNFGLRDYSLDLISFLCEGTLRFDKTGVSDTAFVSTTYVPRNIASSTEESFTQGYIQGFTYGDIIISVLAMLIFSIVIYDFLYRWVRGNKIKQD